MTTIDRDALIAELRRQATAEAMAPSTTWRQAFANLADSLEGGWLAPPTEDVMAGAIDRLREHLGGSFSREVSLALNEAYRNGMRCAPMATEVRVRIPGLDEYSSTDGSWIAYLDNDEDGTCFYRVEGDPNGVAVGRFKASLRKFLGVA